MVAIINPGQSLRRAFQYNENKVEASAAALLSRQNFPFGVESDRYLRLKMLEKVAALRPDVKVNSVHISLNFSPNEQLPDEKMERIAMDYMERIGFGDQPYLVYRHNDAGHDHCHIVTTNVTMNADRISLHHLGILKSEPARKELERVYGLVKAEDHKKDLLSIKPVDARKVIYGKIDTKRAIGNVLAEVLGNFKFTSLPELNAVLNLYNVHAERGKEGSRLFQFGGLQYHVLNADADPVGSPIKASLFPDRPTLKNLEKLFVKHDVARQPFKKRLQTIISFTLKSQCPKSLQELKELLNKDNIKVIPRLSKEGVIYGITYIDLKTKCVFNGSALGKQFSAKAILESIHLKPNAGNSQTIISAQKSILNQPQGISKSANTASHSDAIPQNYNNEKSIMELLTQYEFASSSVPYEWRKKKRKRKKKID